MPFVLADGRIVSPLPVEAADSNRDSLSKTIYSRMFDWLVARVNNAVGQDASAAAVVGVLDIYGKFCSSFSFACHTLT